LFSLVFIFVLLEGEQKGGVGVFVAPIFDLILLLVLSMFITVFMLNLDEKGSNLLPLILLCL